MKLEDYLVIRMGRAARDSVVSMVMAQQNLLPELIAIIEMGTPTQRMKGTWVLSGIQAADGDIIKPYHQKLLECLNVETIGGVKRELLRCFDGARMSDSIAEQLLGIAMEWVTDEKQDFAVRYVCYRLLKPLLKPYKELQNELRNKVELYRSKFGRFP